MNDSLRVADFQYDLPPDRVAHAPLADRGAAKLMVFPRQTGALTHRLFHDLASHLRGDELFVYNDTRVVPARLKGLKPTGGAVEFLVLGLADGTATQDVIALGRSSKPIRVGLHVTLTHGGAVAETATEVEVLEVLGEGRYRLRLPIEPDGLWDFLDLHGEMPLPPYIVREGGPTQADRADYQTVFARHPGAVAAPTAGLHFDDAALKAIEARGCGRTAVTLHVGPGTFRPVRVEHLADHQMHTERYDVTDAAAATIREARAAGRPIVAVGTTVVRTLEASARRHGEVAAGRGETDIFLYPGETFQVVDQLITNFHLPGSTLLMLVSAFAGHARTMKAYADAVALRYRFYSYGDGMWIR
jgi:S-adenosylmethionine:tRNA ribosyltransferase-isomerase